MGEKPGLWRDIFGLGSVCGVMPKPPLIGDTSGLLRDSANSALMFFWTACSPNIFSCGENKPEVLLDAKTQNSEPMFLSSNFCNTFLFKFWCSYILIDCRTCLLYSQNRPTPMGDSAGELKNSLCCCLSQQSGVCKPLTFFIGLDEKWLCKYQNRYIIVYIEKFLVHCI